MDPNAYVITFPTIVAGALSVAGIALGFLVKKWISDSDKAQADKDAATTKAFAEIHESFQVLHKRIDDERTKREEQVIQEAIKREALAELVANLRVELAKAATREELAELNARIDRNTQEILKALAARG